MQNDWIPFAEEQPSPGEHIWICKDGDRNENMGHFEYKPNTRIFEDGFYTHWMPLIKPDHISKQKKKVDVGEPGTEQYTIKTFINDKLFREQKIHDPFINTRVITTGKDLWKALFKGALRIVIDVSGTPLAHKAVFGMDPTEIIPRVPFPMDNDSINESAVSSQ